MLQLSLNSLLVPSSLFIKDSPVQIHKRGPKGGYSIVHIGTYRDSLVAIKQVYAVDIENSAKKYYPNLIGPEAKKWVRQELLELLL